MGGHDLIWAAAVVAVLLLIFRFGIRFIRNAAIAIIAAWVLWAGGLEVVVVIGGAILSIAWVISVRMNGRIADVRCHGTGRHYGWFPWFQHRFRLCSACGGNGRALSPAVNLVGTARQRDELRDQREARRNRWTER